MKLKIFCDTAISVEKQYNEWGVDKIIDKTLLSTTDNSTTLAVWYKEKEMEGKYRCSCGCIIDRNDVEAWKNLKSGNSVKIVCPCCAGVSWGVA